MLTGSGRCLLTGYDGGVNIGAHCVGGVSEGIGWPQSGAIVSDGVVRTPGGPASEGVVNIGGNIVGKVGCGEVMGGNGHDVDDGQIVVNGGVRVGGVSSGQVGHIVVKEGVVGPPMPGVEADGQIVVNGGVVTPPGGPVTGGVRIGKEVDGQIVVN